MLDKRLIHVFAPPRPEQIPIPWDYLGLVAAVTIAAVLVAGRVWMGVARRGVLETIDLLPSTPRGSGGRGSRWKARRSDNDPWLPAGLRAASAGAGDRRNHDRRFGRRFRGVRGRGGLVPVKGGGWGGDSPATDPGGGRRPPPKAEHHGPAAAAAARRPWVAAAVLGLLAVLLSLAAAGPGVLPGDVAVGRGVEALPAPWLDTIAHAANAAGAGWIGFTLLTLLALVPLLLARSYRLAVLVATASALRLVVFPLKALVASPRPTPDLVRVAEIQADPGFPSGHAFGATVLFGALWIVMPALVKNRGGCRLLRGGAVAMVALMLLARIRVGAHWPSDVLGGVLWGATMLALLASAIGGVNPPADQLRGFRSPDATRGK